MWASQNLGYHVGVPHKRTIVFWGLYWGPPILGNYHIHTYIHIYIYIYIEKGCVSIYVYIYMYIYMYI